MESLCAYYFLADHQRSTPLLLPLHIKSICILSLLQGLVFTTDLGFVRTNSHRMVLHLDQAVNLQVKIALFQ